MAILEARGLVKFYGRRKVVDGVNFGVNLGEIVGLLGPNGAGKTTSFRMTTGELTPNEGSVVFDGQDVTELPMFRRARLGMGYLPQLHSVFRKLTVEDNILAILEAMPRSRSLGRKLKRTERIERCNQVLEQFGLTHIRKNNAWACSGGEKRRLEIARCLVCEPLLILLDEPFAGVDPMTKAEIRQTVSALSREQNIGILITDHDIREVLKTTDRIYLIKDGQVRTQGTPQELINDPVAVNEYLGTTFSDDGLGAAPTEGRGLALTQRQDHAKVHAIHGHPPVPVHAPAFSVAQALEQEAIRKLIEALRIESSMNQAARLLVSKGQTAIPALVDALERTEVDLRYRAHHVLSHLVPGLPFEASAPDLVRRQQVAHIRDSLSRRAG